MQPGLVSVNLLVSFACVSDWDDGPQLRDFAILLSFRVMFVKRRLRGEHSGMRTVDVLCELQGVGVAMLVIEGGFPSCASRTCHWLVRTPPSTCYNQAAGLVHTRNPTELTLSSSARHLTYSTVFRNKHKMEAADARRGSAPYGKACTNCVKAKCRCIVRDAGTCERQVESSSPQNRCKAFEAVVFCSAASGSLRLIVDQVPTTEEGLHTVYDSAYSRRKTKGGFQEFGTRRQA